MLGRLRKRRVAAGQSGRGMALGCAGRPQIGAGRGHVALPGIFTAPTKGGAVAAIFRASDHTSMGA